MAASRRGKSRGGRRRRPSPPIRLLEHDLQRRNLARLRKEKLLEDMRGFLDLFPRLAQRRRADRQDLLNKTAGELLAWGALITERGSDRRPQKLFAASGLLLGPCDPWWAGLLASGLEEEVTAHVVSCARKAQGDGPTFAELDGPAPAETRSLPMLQRLVGQIEASTASAEEVQGVATELLSGAIAETSDGHGDSDALLESCLALSLLDEPLPISGEHLNGTMPDALAALAADFPAMLDHARSHAEDPDFDSEEDEDDEDPGDDFDVSLSLARSMDLVDKRLAMSEDPDEGALLARLAATLLLSSCTQFLADHELQVGIESRLWAALLALSSEDDGLRVGEVPEASLESVQQDLRRATGFLKSDAPAPRRAAATTAERFSRLDVLVSALSRAAASEDIETSVAGTLGLAGAAAEVMRAGIDLDGASLTRGVLVRALAVLDPAALDVDREARQKATRELEGLARAVSED